MGAQELRNGTLPSRPASRNGYLSAMSVDQLFDSVAVRLKAEEVGGLSVKVNFTVTDLDEQWVLGLENRALHYVGGRHDADAAVTFALSKSVLLEVAEGARTFDEVIAAGDATATGDVAAAGAIFDHLDVFMSMFNLVEP
jgi:alkyl sulfatase BDS1-like metallo-beta-lactamase superfamily hydrolase